MQSDEQSHYRQNSTLTQENVKVLSLKCILVFFQTKQKALTAINYN